MPAKPLTEEQLEESRALKRLFNDWKAINRATQEDALEGLGFGQSALSQYLNGRIPLNPGAAAKFARLMRCEVATFAPSIARRIEALQTPGTQSTVTTGSHLRAAAALEVRASDSTEEPVQPSPTIGATILQLGSLLATLSPMGLKTVAALVEEVLKDPAKAKEAAETADAIARTQRMPVTNESIARSFGRAQESPVETGFSPLDRLK